MQIRKNSKKYPSEYVFIKNDKLAYLAGFLLLLVTALATMLGIAPQDVKEFSHTWWYELIINIVNHFKRLARRNKDCMARTHDHHRICRCALPGLLDRAQET